MVGDINLMTRPSLPPAIAEGRLVIVARRLERSRLEAILTLAPPESLVIEITLDSSAATDDIAWLRGLGITVGAGTALSRAEAESAIDAGATFLVSPLFDEDLVSWAAGVGVPIAPGAMTPTEIARAWNAGAAAVKVFPASVVGPALLREVRGPLGHIPIMPTGGVSPENARLFLDAGAVAVGVGGWLTAGPESTLGSRWAEITAALGSA